jgi:hypothetical protein
LIKSADQGNSWNIIGGATFGIADFEFTNSQEGWISSESRSLFRTSNGGKNWDTLHIATTLKENILNFEFFNSKLSYGITQIHIYYTNNGWETFSIVDSIVADIYNQESNTFNFTLHQNYPNPFNPTTKIKYEIPKHSRVTIRVFDLLGHEIDTLVDRENDAGVHEVDFNSKDLPSGVYFYKLYADGFVKTKKMILIR